MDPFLILGWILVVVVGAIAAFTVVIIALLIGMAVRRAFAKPTEHQIIGGRDE